MTKAIFPGSFDPVTNGHLDLIGRASGLFEDLVIAVGFNPNKRGWLSPAQRVDLLQEVLKNDLPGASIEVISFDGLLVDAAKRVGATVVVKGVRTARDFDSEYSQAAMNKDLGGVETLLLPSSPQWQYVSSTLVREAYAVGGSISKYVPSAVVRELERDRG